jgi:hypothetical protein
MTPTKGATLMRKRLKTIGGAAAALVALALGGSAIASATQGTPTSSKANAAPAAVAPEKTTGPDIGNVQSGDQTTPDTSSAKASAASTPESGSATETSSETSAETPESGSATETSAASDGPGGHEDPAGNVENQSETQE